MRPVSLSNFSFAIDRAGWYVIQHNNETLARFSPKIASAFKEMVKMTNLLDNDRGTILSDRRKNFIFVLNQEFNKIKKWKDIFIGNNIKLKLPTQSNKLLAIDDILEFHIKTLGDAEYSDMCQSILDSYYESFEKISENKRKMINFSSKNVGTDTFCLYAMNFFDEVQRSINDNEGKYIFRNMFTMKRFMLKIKKKKTNGDKISIDEREIYKEIISKLKNKK